MDILKEAEEIARRYAHKKPDGITDNNWTLAQPETRELLLGIGRLKKPLETASTGKR